MNRSKYVDRNDDSVMMDKGGLRLGLSQSVVLPVISMATAQAKQAPNSASNPTPRSTSASKQQHRPRQQENESAEERAGSLQEAKTEDDRIKTRAPNSLINNYLIKLTMFLVTTVVFSPNLTGPVNSHKHLFQNNNNNQQHQHQSPHHQLQGHHEYIMLNQRQALDHLIRGQNHQNHHHHFLSQPQQQQQQQQYQSGADRRASSAAATAATGDYPSNGGQQNNAADTNGKLLVCYYTTRSSPPYWPSNDARGYIVPPEDVVMGSNGNGNGPSQELRQSSSSGFSPMLHYEPFPSIQRDSQQQQQQQQQQLQQLQQVNNGGQDYGAAGNMKNQQQQLVFKSAAVMQPSTFQLATGSGSSGSYGGRSAASNHNGPNSLPNAHNTRDRSYKSRQQYQEMFVTESPMGQASSNYQQYQQSLHLVDGGQNVSHLKSKQMPAYSFIGPDNNNSNNNLDIANINNGKNNNGLIVSSGGGGSGTSFVHGFGSNGQQASAAPTVSAPSSLLAGNNGNVGFIISNQQRGDAGGNGVGANPPAGGNNGPPATAAAAAAASAAATTLDNHLERSLLGHQQQQQQQQLVFSPSLSRAFIVGGDGGGNNEALDTKSQLFIPSSQQQQQQPNINNNHYSLIQQTTTVSSMPSMLYQQHEHEPEREHLMQPITPVQLQQRGKSLQVSALNSDQLSPAAAASSNGAAAGPPFSGAVSNAPSVPLSPASTHQTSQAASHPTPVSAAAAAAASLHQPASSNIYRHNSQQLQTPFLPSLGSQQQLIVSNGPPQQQQQQVAPANVPQQSTKTNHNHHNQQQQHHHHHHHLLNSGTNFSKTPFSPSDHSPPSGKSSSLSSSSTNANANHFQFSNGNQQQQQQQQPVSNGSAGPSSASASATMLHNQQLAPTASSSSTISSPSSSLVSSPLSTMFDVFGAASQYLMRFKPSSLISPASFVFNSINSNHNLASSGNGGGEHPSHGGSGHGHHGLKSSSANGSSSPSLLSSLAASASNSLIPLPFSAASSLVANLQKSASAASGSSASSSSMSANDRSSSSPGILSRFSLQNSNNQRREDVCGRTIQSPQRRIIGGEGARYGEFPYQVHIKIAKHQCGGALVDKQSIVTAAHCVYHFITRAPVSKLQIVIGAYDIEDEQYQELPPQYFKVNKVKLHPNFRFSASHPDRYDIAILKLDKPVKYTDNVLPVCLPSKELKFENMVGTVTGFGKTDPSLSNRYGTRLLQKVDVPIIENNECERWHRTRGIDLKIFPEMMCAGYEDGLKDACVGDSGGPLVVKTSTSGPGGSGGSRWTLAGITSAGFGCAQSRQPGIYHRVSHTVDWILENLD